jgi:hypothetical protein
MPAKNGVWLNQNQSLLPTGEPTLGKDPKSAVCIAQSWSLLPSLEHHQLLP